jgi:hypothetical protein
LTWSGGALGDVACKYRVREREKEQKKSKDDRSVAQHPIRTTRAHARAQSDWQTGERTVTVVTPADRAASGITMISLHGHATTITENKQTKTNEAEG